jgi:hypothetical protein
MSDPKDIIALIEKAARAPSSHNTQPWLFRRRQDAVEVHADRTRALPVNDPHGREMTISCGAALFNLESAAAEAGHGTETTLLPEPADPNHLATVEFGGPADSAGASLAAQIENRLPHTAFKWAISISPVRSLSCAPDSGRPWRLRASRKWCCVSVTFLQGAIPARVDLLRMSCLAAMLEEICEKTQNTSAAPGLPGPSTTETSPSIA